MVICFLEWSAMAAAGDNGGLVSGSGELQSYETKPEPEKEPGRIAPLTITPTGNSYYGSQTSLNDDRKIPGTPETPIGDFLVLVCVFIRTDKQLFSCINCTIKK